MPQTPSHPSNDLPGLFCSYIQMTRSPKEDTHAHPGCLYIHATASFAADETQQRPGVPQRLAPPRSI